jgi:3-phosphoshikimate 1-carboxyvinyltransferase
MFRRNAPRFAAGTCSKPRTSSGFSIADDLNPLGAESDMSHDQKTPLTSRRSGPLRGRLKVPGDKSISHRSLIFGALATGETTVEGLLEAGDVLGTARVLGEMGVPIEKQGGLWRVRGRGTGGLEAPAAPLDFGNSGTGTRLLMGVLTGHHFKARLTGDASLSRRPMGRVLKPLRQMGLAVVEGEGDRLPLTIQGPRRAIPITYALDVPSAQVKSAILLAGLGAPGETTVIEHEATRDHTERMLAHFGAPPAITPEGKGCRITVRGDAELAGRHVAVPGDPSSAAFLVAAALIAPDSEVTIEGVLVNPSRTGFYATLQEMGADIELANQRIEGGEPVADVRVRHSELTGVCVPPERAPSMIDEYPMLAALAAYAEGETRMEGLAELKVKESDRLAATAAGLAANGIRARVDGDTLTVEGTGMVAGGGTVATHLDHRIAMAFLTLGLGADRPVTVDDTAMIQTSFPEFLGLMRGLGASMGES